MAWGRKRRPPEEPPAEITAEVLAVVPVRLDYVELREDSHGHLHLRVSLPPKGVAKHILNWLRQDYSRTYELDEFGSFFYQQVDGHTTLKMIIRRMAKHFHRPFEETEVAVIQFTKLLMTKNMLALQMPAHEA
jgi:hypothetical protein